MPTRIIDNFSGRLTRQNIGALDSGLAKYETTFGSDPFSNPSNLTWMEEPIAINNPDGVGNSSLCMASRPRLESLNGTNVTYVYALFDNARISKIQVNNPATYNANYDNPVALTTLTAQGPSFIYGSSIQFYGATEKMFIGHDNGITKVNFDGTGESFVGNVGSYTQNVPRPSAQFLGKLYFGNGNNLIEIDTTETVTSYTKLSPGFPTGTYVRDLDVSPDGNYLQIIVCQANSPKLNTIDQDTNSMTSASSYKFLWNGTNATYTSYESYTGAVLNSNTVFGPHSFMMGYDLGGAGLYSGNQKIISLPTSTSPNFGSMFSTGNMLGMAMPEYIASTNTLQSHMLFYGQYDVEVPKGLFRLLRKAAVTGNDVVQMPMCTIVSNLFYGSLWAAYPGNIVSSAKVYFSAFETTTNNRVYYKFYKFTLVPTGLGTAIGGVYETQQETSFKLFRSIVSKKFKVSEVRFYVEPLVTNNSFKIDLIGSDGNPMSGGSATFTVGSGGITAGEDVVKYTPQTEPTYSVGVRITNLGSKNWTGLKMELDYEEFGTK